MPELIGQIKKKQKVKVYKKNSLHKGKSYWKLFPAIENVPDVKQIQVYQDKIAPEIWHAIENTNYYGKTYLFRCLRYSWSSSNYELISWRELKSEAES